MLQETVDTNSSNAILAVTPTRSKQNNKIRIIKSLHSHRSSVTSSEYVVDRQVIIFIVH